MEAIKHLRPYFHRLLLWRFTRRGGNPALMVIDFDDLQRLSGYKQVSKVIEWLREQRVAYVVGGDGKPRTTHDMLRTVLNGTDEERDFAPIRFG